MTIKTPKLKRKSDLILLAGPFGWTDESRNDEWLILAKAFPGVGIRVGSCYHTNYSFLEGVMVHEVDLQKDYPVPFVKFYNAGPRTDIYPNRTVSGLSNIIEYLMNCENQNVYPYACLLQEEENPLEFLELFVGKEYFDRSNAGDWQFEEYVQKARALSEHSEEIRGLQCQAYEMLRSNNPNKELLSHLLDCSLDLYERVKKCLTPFREKSFQSTCEEIQQHLSFS